MKSEAAHVIIIIITQNVDEFTVSNASFCSSDIFINVNGMIFFNFLPAGFSKTKLTAFWSKTHSLIDTIYSVVLFCFAWLLKWVLMQHLVHFEN